MVSMIYATQSVTESSNGATVDVCVNSGIMGNIELPLTVTLTTNNGKASKSTVP